MLAESVCLGCDFRQICDHAGADKPGRKLVRQRRKQVVAGDYLAWEGSRFDTLFAVRSGALKSMSIDTEGHERVREFYLPGEVIGLDALHAGVYLNNVESLVDSQICELPYASLDGALATSAGLRQRILSLLSRNLASALSLHGDYTAEQRIAAFLLDMGQRQPADSRPGQIQLDMGRRDIANYLGLATETVSRVLTRMRGQGIIEANRRQLRIVDTAALKQMAGPLAGQIEYDEAARQAA